MSGRPIKILVLNNEEVLDKLVDLLSRVGLEIEVRGSKGERYVVVGRGESVDLLEVDYVIALSASAEAAVQRSNRAVLLITSTSSTSSSERALSIESSDPAYVAGVVLSLLGVPLEDAISKVRGEERSSFLRGYASTLYRAIGVELARVELGGVEE